jgi:hypothetical protein
MTPETLAASDISTLWICGTQQSVAGHKQSQLCDYHNILKTPAITSLPTVRRLKETRCVSVERERGTTLVRQPESITGDVTILRPKLTGIPWSRFIHFMTMDVDLEFTWYFIQGLENEVGEDTLLVTATLTWLKSLWASWMQRQTNNPRVKTGETETFGVKGSYWTNVRHFVADGGK